jgi:kynurenine formamidase
MSVTRLVELLDAAEIEDLAHGYFTGMPQSPNHPPFRFLLERRHGDVVRADGGSAANELIVTGGHVGTHVDALGHVSHDGLVHGGIPAGDIQSNTGLAQLGIERFPPYVGRAVLLDVAGAHGTDCLPPGYEVTVADLEAAAVRRAVEFRDGDVILVGTGWSRRWTDRKTFTGLGGGVPGPGVAAARWLAERHPCAVGAESIAFEHLPPGAGHALLPVHRIMLVEHGINIIETMNLARLLERDVAEFVIVLNPLQVIGATGSPVRPLAILS